MKNPKLPRRDFIKIGSGIIIYPLIATPFSCTTPDPPKTNWRSEEHSSDHLGQLRIIDVNGLASFDGKPLAPGMSISKGQLLTVNSGHVHAALPDGSMVRLSQKAEISVDLDSKEGGLIEVKNGAVLSVVRPRRKRPVLLKMASAVIGVRGTVCFAQVINEEDKQNPKIPKNATDYFCLCNGEIAYLNSTLDSVKLDKSEYHSAKFLIPEKSGLVFKDAGLLLNHTDSEIKTLIDLMPGAKHPSDWLFPSNKKPYY